jgi:hypothetical protein
VAHELLDEIGQARAARGIGGFTDPIQDLHCRAMAAMVLLHEDPEPIREPCFDHRHRGKPNLRGRRAPEHGKAEIKQIQ